MVKRGCIIPLLPFLGGLIIFTMHLAHGDCFGIYVASVDWSNEVPERPFLWKYVRAPAKTLRDNVNPEDGSHHHQAMAHDERFIQLNHLNQAKQGVRKHASPVWHLKQPRWLEHKRGSFQRLNTPSTRPTEILTAGPIAQFSCYIPGVEFCKALRPGP